MTSAALLRVLASLRPAGPAAVSDGRIPGNGADDEYAEARDALGEGMFAWTLEQSREDARNVLESVPRSRVGILAEPLARAIETSALDLMLFLVDHRHVTLTPAQHRAISELVRVGVPFQRNIDGLRIVQRRWQHTLFDAIEERGPVAERTALMREAADAIGSYFGQVIDAVISAFFVERQRLMAQRITSQRELVTTIVDGELPDEAVVRRTLGLEPGDHHLGIVLWAEPGVERRADPYEELERAAHLVADAVGCNTPLILAGVGAATIWAWAGRAKPIDADDLDSVGRVDPGAPAVRAAVGSPAAGLAGFRRSHLTAMDARRVAQTCRTDGPVVLHRDVALLAALTGDLERARWFVEAELGRLAAADRPTAELRRTALAYLETGGSLVATAARLHVHRNTVIYRIRRASELLGHALTERTLETHAALRVSLSCAATLR